MKHQPESSVDYDKLLAKIDVPLITRFIPIAAMKTDVHNCHAEEKRLRRLPAWLIVLLCIMRGVYCREALGPTSEPVRAVTIDLATATIEAPILVPTEEIPPTAEIVAPPTVEIMPTSPPPPPPPPQQSCCKICSNSKACGDSCISKSYNCHKGPGCACNASIDSGIVVASAYDNLLCSMSSMLN